MLLSKRILLSKRRLKIKFCWEFQGTNLVLDVIAQSSATQPWQKPPKITVCSWKHVNLASALTLFFLTLSLSLRDHSNITKSWRLRFGLTEESDREAIFPKQEKFYQLVFTILLRFNFYLWFALILLGYAIYASQKSHTKLTFPFSQHSTENPELIKYYTTSCLNIGLQTMPMANGHHEKLLLSFHYCNIRDTTYTLQTSCYSAIQITEEKDASFQRKMNLMIFSSIIDETDTKFSF